MNFSDVVSDVVDSVAIAKDVSKREATAYVIGYLLQSEGFNVAYITDDGELMVN